MPLEFDLNEHRAVMAMHHAACEAWDAYSDPARNSLTTIRVKNETQAALSTKVAELLRELQALRGERAVMVDVLRECDKVISVAKMDAESTDEDGALEDLLSSIKRLTLVRQVGERDLLTT